MKDVKQEESCPTCGKQAYHDLVADHSGGNVDSQNQEYTMWGEHGTRLYGACYLPHQLNEAKRKHPNRQFREVNGCLLPVIKHRCDKLQYLKEYGNYVEYD
jgi:hypothetical protein